MRKIFLIIGILVAIDAVIIGLLFHKTYFEKDITLSSPTPLPSVDIPRHTPTTVPKPQATPTGASTTSHVLLNVPYVNETPENLTSKSWVNACEEASIAMVDEFYKGTSTVDIKIVEAFMQRLFDIQDQLYGSNGNSDAERTNYLINNFTHYKGRIVENATLDQIKSELRNEHPVIVFHYGFDLGNKNIPFRATGPSYHATVIRGYDDSRNVFIVNDPGDEVDGENHIYAYDIYMNSIHDFDYTTGLANGPARVIFTSGK